MKIASIVARYLLGLMFTVFGLNGFLHFIHQPPPANPLAIQFLVAVSASHFAAFFFAVQVLGGLLLLSGFFVPLALTLLAAELYNILAFHITLAPSTAAPAARGLRAVGAGLPSVPRKLQGHLQREAATPEI
jgi:putative oxidoreductase